MRIYKYDANPRIRQPAKRIRELVNLHVIRNFVSVFILMENLLAVKFLDPEAVLQQLKVMQGMKAADFGCGPGYFSLPFAEKIGSDGVLYAIDVLPQALEAVESQARISGLHNIRTMRANLESSKELPIDQGSLDIVIIKDVLFHNQDKRNILKHAHKVLKTDGMLLVVEWNSKDESIGPVTNLRVKEEDLRDMLEQENFIITKEIEAGNFHYGMLAIKK